MFWRLKSNSNLWKSAKICVLKNTHSSPASWHPGFKPMTYELFAWRPIPNASDLEPYTLHLEAIRGRKQLGDGVALLRYYHWVKFLPQLNSPRFISAKYLTGQAPVKLGRPVESRIQRIGKCEIKFTRFSNCFHIISFDIMTVSTYKYM